MEKKQQEHHRPQPATQYNPMNNWLGQWMPVYMGTQAYHRGHFMRAEKHHEDLWLDSKKLRELFIGSRIMCELGEDDARMTIDAHYACLFFLNWFKEFRASKETNWLVRFIEDVSVRRLGLSPAYHAHMVDLKLKSIEQNPRQAFQWAMMWVKQRWDALYPDLKLARQLGGSECASQSLLYAHLWTGRQIPSHRPNSRLWIVEQKELWEGMSFNRWFEEVFMRRVRDFIKIKESEKLDILATVAVNMKRMRESSSDHTMGPPPAKLQRVASV